MTEKQTVRIEDLRVGDVLVINGATIADTNPAAIQLAEDEPDSWVKRNALKRILGPTVEIQREASKQLEPFNVKAVRHDFCSFDHDEILIHVPGAFRDLECTVIPAGYVAPKPSLSAEGREALDGLCAYAGLADAHYVRNRARAIRAELSAEPTARPVPALAREWALWTRRQGGTLSQDRAYAAADYILNQPRPKLPKDVEEALGWISGYGHEEETQPLFDFIRDLGYEVEEGS